jgi:hypothetical protein
LGALGAEYEESTSSLAMPSALSWPLNCGAWSNDTFDGRAMVSGTQ